MAAADRSTIDSILKRMWSPRGIQDITYEKSPFYGRLKKVTTFGGDAMKVPVDIAPTSGASRDFATALANQVGAKGVAFLIQDMKLDYSFFGITTLALRTAKDNTKAFVNGLERESKAAFKAQRMSMNRSLFRNTGGAIGRIASGSSSTVLTLTDRSDAVHFHVGMKIVSHNTDGVAGTDDGSAITITGVDKDAGTITKAAGSDWDAGGFFQANDYLFREGDTGQAMHGLDSWLPSTRPTVSDSYLGVNRSQDATGLAGVLYTADPGTDGSLEDTLINASIEAGIHGGEPNVVYCNNRVLGKLIRELGSKTHYERMPARDSSGKEIAKIGYKGVVVHTDQGEVVVMSDRNCPLETMYMLDESSWFLLSAGEPIGWLDEDGSKSLRSGTYDGIDFRIGGYCELVCDAPGHNVRIDLSGLNLFA